MSSARPQPESAPPRETPDASEESDARFLWLVAGLSVMIVLTLAGLWTMEYRQRIQAQTDIMEMERALGEQKKKMQFLGMALANQEGSRLVRKELPTQTVTLQGQPQTVFLLAAPMAARIGLLPGDLLLVTPPAKPSPENGLTPKPTP